MNFVSATMFKTISVRKFFISASTIMVAGLYCTAVFSGEIHEAVKAKDKSGIDKAIAAGADLEETDFMIGPALHIAVSLGDLEIADFLIKRGAEINSAGEIQGNRPIHISSEFGDLEMIQLLISAGSDIDALDTDGRTALFRASAAGQALAVKLLLDNGAKVDSRESRLQQTPLHRAADNGNVDVVKLLVERSADVNAVDRSGNSPFSLAAQPQSFSNVGDARLLEYLLALGADPFIKNSHGQTPLDYAKIRHDGTWGDIVKALEKLIQK